MAHSACGTVVLAVVTGFGSVLPSEKPLERGETVLCAGYTSVVTCHPSAALGECL